MLLFGLLLVVYLFDTIELLRRAAKVEGLPVSLVLQMGLFKLPDVGQQIFPFAVLFSALFTFWQLTRRSELVVVRAAGLSVWQFMMPLAFAAFLIGTVQMMVVNPVGALLIAERQTTRPIVFFVKRFDQMPELAALEDFGRLRIVARRSRVIQGGPQRTKRQVGFLWQKQSLLAGRTPYIPIRMRP